MQTLSQLDLEPGVQAIPGNLRKCYQALVQKAFIGAEELPLVEAWLHDLAALGHPG
jgi:hypothetical protein